MLDCGRQFQTRLRAYLDELPRHLYTPVAEVPVEGFVTRERLTPAQAEQAQFVPFPEGTSWGGCWEYGWFRADVTLPAGCEGRRVVLLGQVGGEQLYYVNGQAAGAVDRKHSYVTLTRRAKAGERFHILAESYAGHGARLEELGPCPPERPVLPPVPAAQCTVGRTVIALWNEDAYQLLMDADTLSRLLQVLPDKSLRAQRVARALQTFTDIVDFELPAGARQETFVRARQALREALDCRNGSTAPLMWLIGQSHIDLAWLWPMEDTLRKAVRTFSNQMTLLDEYPDYRYLLCEPALLDMLRAQDSQLWLRVKDACTRGQILPEGAFYVECDTNLPSGESLIRQLQWGRKWFREELGVDSQVGWLPDCFGFSAALPQLLKGLGIPYFATQKLQRADPECERFPYHHFIWEGLDGSEVLGLSFMKDNGPVDPLSFTQRWEDNRVQMQDIDTLLHPFGYGDGGGGPTRDMVELSLRLNDLEGVPRSRYGGLREYFEHIAAQGVKNRWVGELYLSWHRGVFTSQRRGKALMRRAEFALHDAEAMAAKLPGGPDAQTRDTLHECWRQLLLCQFHDVAGGVGIHRVHEEAEEQLRGVIARAQALTQAMRRTVYGIRPEVPGETVCNPLPFARTEWLTSPDGTLRYVHAPADGAAPLWDLPHPTDAQLHRTDAGYVLENRFLSLTVDADGTIIRLLDRENGCELLRPGQRMNDWRLYRNLQTVYDAWELDRNWEEQQIPGAVAAQVSVLTDTPALCALRIERSFGDSTSVQTLRLYASSRRVDFATDIDWHERRRMLKTHFESNLLSGEALHEIQFGYLARPAHRSTRYASDRYEVCNHRYSALCEENRGFAVLNDGSYGISSNRGELALTLLRAPLVPDDTNNQGHHRLTYALYVFATSFRESDTVRQGYALNAPLTVEQGLCAGTFTGCEVESRSVMLETIKPAEKAGDVILRLYNSQRTRERALLCLPVPGELSDCGLTEGPGEPLGTGDAFTLDFGPFQVRTFRLRPVRGDA